MSASALYFKNTSDQDFTHNWDSVPYTVKAGEEMLVQSHIAIHLAKHLAMRELGRRNKYESFDPSQDDHGQFTNEIFRMEVAKYLSQDTVEESTPEKLEIAILKEEKKAKKVKKEVKEEEFPELKK